MVQVQGLGSVVEGLELRVQGLRFRVQGEGVYGLKKRVSVYGLGFGVQASGVGSRVQVLVGPIPGTDPARYTQLKRFEEILHECEG